MTRSVAIAETCSRLALPRTERARLERLGFHDAGHGYDILGLHPAWVAACLGALRLLYKYYFRVTSHGAHHVPSKGPAILAANHSGTLPLDGAMLYFDVLANTHPPRVPRAVMDFFVPVLPFIGTIFSRAGGTAGARHNVRYLLESGELLMVFPEGTPGIGKTIWNRYQLQTWRVGHAELAIRHQAPIVPVAIIGAEEQWPQIAKIDAHPFGAPYLPIPLTPIPLPVHYHIYYGKPLRLHERFPPEASDDPDLVEHAAKIVKGKVQELIERGLHERRGIFR